MDKDEIIRMAREAGVSIRGHYDETGLTPQELERFASLVAAHEREVLLKDNPYLAEQLQAYIHIATTVEREACAKVCDRVGYHHEVQQGAELAFDLAAAIRARGEE